jgi:hypothetical protein
MTVPLLPRSAVAGSIVTLTCGRGSTMIVRSRCQEFPQMIILKAEVLAR